MINCFRRLIGCTLLDAVFQVSATQTLSWTSYGMSLIDPAGSSSIVAAVQWLEGTLLGTIATTVAVIAVASVGFMALSGRVDLRRALTTILGCFVVFGASSIVAGIQIAIRDGEWEDGRTSSVAVETSSPLTDLPQRRPAYDPYAGAAVPTR